MLAILLFAFGCGAAPCADGFGRDDDGNCVPLATDSETPADDTGPADTAPPDDTGGADTGSADTGAEPAPEFALGDPITTLGADDANDHDAFFEMVEAVILDDDHAALFGQGGIAIASRDDGEYLEFVDAHRIFRADRDAQTGLVWGSTRSQEVMGIDFTDPLGPVSVGQFTPQDTWHEDISADGGRILLGMQEAGAVLWDEDGQELGTLPADYAFGVALLGDRALVTDEMDLVLWDVTDPSSAVELDRVTLSGEGRDIAFDGQRIAVALGGDGAAVLDLEDDVLIERGDLETPGACFGVALDGDYLWMAAWAEAALAWVGAGDPMILGHEPASEIALGIDAADGRASLADWFHSTAFERADLTAGPEIVIDETIWFPADDASDQALTVGNAGVAELNVTFQDDALNSYSLDRNALTLAPGESEVIWITPGDFPGWTHLAWSSDDPDEASGETALQVSEFSLGFEHQDFDLYGFTWPDTALALYNADSLKGQVLYLVYFTTW